MKIEKVIVVVFISLVTAVTSGLIAQQGGMQMPPGMQGQMPTPEQIEEMIRQQMKMMEAQMKATVDQEFPKYDDDEDGKLSADEFEDLYKLMMVGMQSGTESQTDEEKAEQMKKQFEEMDGDDDDSLTKEEIVAWSVKKMKEDAGIEDSEEDEEDAESEDEANEEEADSDEEEED